MNQIMNQATNQASNQTTHPAARKRLQHPTINNIKEIND
jgi:hypothetical protein